MDRLVPVMVRTFGRTGSTLLMQILGSSDQVCFEREYPFEHRYLTYVYNMARVAGLPATVPGNVNVQWDNDVMFRGKSPVVGCLPYGKVNGVNRGALSKKLFASIWDDFSSELRRSNGIASGQTAYYAEKVPQEVAHMANELLMSKNIFLLRDPRDEMVSIKSFNQKRGFNSFGWLDTDTDISYAHKMCRNRQKFMRTMIGFESNHRRIHVRYEDLIRRGDEEVERLSDWLGVPMCLSTATRNKKIRQIHMTSKDASSSVERWRTELSDDVQKIFSRDLGAELDGLGYAV